MIDSDNLKIKEVVGSLREETINTTDILKQRKTDNNSTSFWANINYLLENGINLMMCFNAYMVPKVDIKEQVRILKEEYGYSDEDAKSMVSRNYQSHKSSFDFSNLDKGNSNFVDDANKHAITIIIHNITFAFTDYDKELIKYNNGNNNETPTITKELYESKLHNYWLTVGKEDLRDTLVANQLQIQRTWFSVPWRKEATIEEINQGITGYNFDKLENAEIVKAFDLFKYLKKDFHSHIISFSDTYGVKLIRNHFTATKKLRNKPYIAFANSINTLEKYTTNFIDFVKTLPVPFNDINSLISIDSSINNYGQIERQQDSINIHKLVERFLNVNLEAMVNRNANSYINAKDIIFIPPNKTNYKKLVLTTLDDFYKAYVRAMINIVKILLLYENEDGSYLNIKKYFEPEIL